MKHLGNRGWVARRFLGLEPLYSALRCPALRIVETFAPTT